MGFIPKYDQADHKLIKFLKEEISESGWAVTPANQVLVPPLILQDLAQREHENTYFWVENLLKHLEKVVTGKEVTAIVRSVVSKCEIYCKKNPDTRRTVVLGATK